MVDWRGEQLLAKLRIAAMRGVVIATEAVRNEAISLVTNSPATGRVYRRRGGVTHQASAPGEPPASDTGTLAGRIDTDYDYVQLRGAVVARTNYSRHLEYGTQRMQPRPFMRPALSSKRAFIEKAIATQIRNTLVG